MNYNWFYLVPLGSTCMLDFFFSCQVLGHFCWEYTSWEYQDDWTILYYIMMADLTYFCIYVSLDLLLYLRHPFRVYSNIVYSSLS
jgi:hypothetical protein